MTLDHAMHRETLAVRISDATTGGQKAWDVDILIESFGVLCCFIGFFNAIKAVRLQRLIFSLIDQN